MTDADPDDYEDLCEQLFDTVQEVCPHCSMKASVALVSFILLGGLKDLSMLDETLAGFAADVKEQVLENWKDAEAERRMVN